MTDQEFAQQFGIYPAGYFDLYRLLSPLIADLYHIRTDLYPAAPFGNTLAYISGLLSELAMDDELGLISATPEQRVLFAESIE